MKELWSLAHPVKGIFRSRVRLSCGLAAAVQGWWCPARGGVPGYWDVHRDRLVMGKGDDKTTS